MDDSFPESIAVRPERDFRIEAIIDNKQLWETMMLLAGPQYAGHEDNARKLPAWTLPDFRSRSEASLQCAIGSGMQNVSDALYFCFYSNRLSSLPHEAISVSKQDLWWLAQRGDSILLSDGIIHHLTSIDKVDNETGRIYFFDPWPDFFFLKEGLNQAGVAARTAGGAGVAVVLRVFRAFVARGAVVAWEVQPARE